MKILIVEDEHRLSDNIRDYLAPQGYLCEQAFDYNQAKMMSGSYAYDCVLLDLMLPGGSGLDVLKAIRKKNMETGSSSSPPRTRLTISLRGCVSGLTIICRSLSRSLSWLCASMP